MEKTIKEFTKAGKGPSNRILVIVATGYNGTEYMPPDGVYNYYGNVIIFDGQPTQEETILFTIKGISPSKHYITDPLLKQIISMYPNSEISIVSHTIEYCPKFDYKQMLFIPRGHSQGSLTDAQYKALSEIVPDPSIKKYMKLAANIKDVYLDHIEKGYGYTALMPSNIKKVYEILLEMKKFSGINTQQKIVMEKILLDIEKYFLFDIEEMIPRVNKLAKQFINLDNIAEKDQNKLSFDLSISTTELIELLGLIKQYPQLFQAQS